ncbi:MAG: GerMN domain-containing protein, partial [Clostridia bacterium]|nr:GerMN domain-containing protein [Clostridia bacterium]
PGSSASGYIHIYLHVAIDDQLALRGSTRAMLASSVCYTLTSFIPQLEGVYIYINNEPITQMELMDGAPWSSQDGLMVRSDFAPYIADMCTVYYPHTDGEYLRAVARPIPQRLKTQPRAIMRELMKPPTYGPYTRALPETMTDADILGLMIDGDTALINLSKSVGETIFHDAPEGLDMSQRNMIYAIVNTLTEIDGVSRVRFYFEGEQQSLDNAQISMRGEFMRNAGIIR